VRPFQHWNCEICKGYNDVLNNHCVFCKAYKPDWITSKHQALIEIDRGIFDWYGILEGRVNNTVTPNEELFAKFYSEEMLLVQGMNDADLDEHIHELESIAREAKSRITAATENKRTRAAKSGNKSWKVEPLGPDPTVTDSLNKVKQRSQRMSKLDKMRDSMAALGIPQSELDQMLSKMVAQARKEPAALKEEVRLKGSLTAKAEPSIITEEQRQEQAAKRKALDAEDKVIEKAEKERLALVHNDKDEKLILVIEPDDEAKVQAKKEAAKQAALNLFGPNITK
jgi:hypothetical protein